MQVGKREETNHIVLCSSFTRPRAKIGVHHLAKKDRLTGWLKCGYHYVITRPGEIEIGRDIDEVGGHLIGHNHDSIFICLIGGLDKEGNVRDTYTEAQRHELKRLLKDLVHTYPDADICAPSDLTGVPNPSPVIDFRQLLIDEDIK